MSDYDKRYNVSVGMVSHYTDDPREALRLLESDEHAPGRSWPWAHPAYCTEGYGDCEYISYGHRDFGGIEGDRITRRTKGKVSKQQLRSRISDLEYKEYRAKVQEMIEAGHAAYVRMNMFTNYKKRFFYPRLPRGYRWAKSHERSHPDVILALVSPNKADLAVPA
jgi:hypothetical protein